MVRCFSLKVPADELCNGLDDDCDGVVDDGNPETGLPCETGALGICAAGTSICNAGTKGCVPVAVARQESCDGLDDDCDGATDEAFLGMCEGCVDPTAEGLCGSGVSVCLDGEIRCAPHLPADWAPPGGGCDGLDSDCDGLTDELTGGEAEGLPAETALLDQARSACPRTPAAPDPLPVCPDDGGRTSRWSCEPGPDGGVCTAQQCDAGLRIEDGRCVDDVERCNDGIDDDGDGLIDGTVGGPDPCMPVIDARGTTWRMGRCDSAWADGHPGCEDNAAIQADGDHNTLCWDPEVCPRRARVSYRYALDREEVSLRAYLACVRSGCCSPAAGRLYALGEQADETGLAPARRPDDVDGCQGAVQLTLEDPDSAALLPDLPVVGVSWCQARNYCAWAGKRLPTEFEWDRAQRGPDPESRRRYAWGNADPLLCPQEHCLGTYGGDPDQCSHLDPSRDCRRCVYGPAPVWSGVDGASAEGLLNMGGNVEEWTFDWFDGQYTYLAEDDPVGRACHPVDSHTARTARDGNFRAERAQSRAGARAGYPQSSHLSFLGFRCGRTLPDDEGICDPQMPLVPANCQVNPAPVACAAPSFTAAQAGDAVRCEQPERAQTDHCLLGIVGLCGAEPAACSAQIATRVQFEPAQIGEHVPPELLEAMAGALPDLVDDDPGRINALVEGVLAPLGGDTLLLFEPPADFGRTFPHRVRLGSGILGQAGVLSWIGAELEGRCDPAPRAEVTVPTVTGALDFESGCQLDASSLWVVEAPMRFRISANRFSGEITASGSQFSVLFVLTVADAEASIWGDPDRPADALLRGTFVPVDLCPLAALLECDQTFDGCTGAGLEATCTGGASTCMGYPLPFVIETVRRDLLDIPGMAPCDDAPR